MLYKTPPKTERDLPPHQHGVGDNKPESGQKVDARDGDLRRGRAVEGEGVEVREGQGGQAVGHEETPGAQEGVPVHHEHLPCRRGQGRSVSQWVGQSVSRLVD